LTRSRGAFSLVEVVISSAVLITFFGIVYETVIAGLREVSTLDEREDARRQLTQTLDRLVREAGTATEMDVAQTARIQFDTDAVNNVEYEYDGAADTLTRDDGSSSAVIIARGVTDFDIDYIDCLGVSYTGTVSTEDRVRVAQVVATIADGAETFSLTNAAYLRNTIGDNGSYCGSL
jgi:hypothetical protein